MLGLGDQMTRIYSRKTSNQAAKFNDHANDSTNRTTPVSLCSVTKKKLKKCNQMQLLVVELTKLPGSPGEESIKGSD